ncbi:hypothetical protein DVH24_015206 [Malus domestica]|uniref:Uncharacterized protein n=1 Tax=Malus domestica TaxID=3750 RepID=A0A498K365_MALDO|nr:hypothetical protein DVH24_015206 [Malus domestica]
MVATDAISYWICAWATQPWFLGYLDRNKQLVDDARKKSKALTDAVQLKDQTFERLTRRNDENLRLKKQLETTILEASKVKRGLDSALAEVYEMNESIPTEREIFVYEFLGSQAFRYTIRPHCTWEVQLEQRK